MRVCIGRSLKLAILVLILILILVLLLLIVIKIDLLELVLGAGLDAAVLSAGELTVLVPVQDVKGFLGVLERVRVVEVEAMVVFALVLAELLEGHQLVLIVIHMAKRVHHGWRIEPLLLGNFAVAVGVNVFEMAMEAVMVTINHTFFTIVGFLILVEVHHTILILVTQVEVVLSNGVGVGWGGIVEEFTGVDETVFVGVETCGGLVIATKSLGDRVSMVLVFVVSVKVLEFSSIEFIVLIDVTLAEKSLWGLVNVNISFWFPHSLNKRDTEKH